jgi:acetyl-CoA/propionyl-CoA carboxylase biotin carboxyl carrier protein
MFDTVLVANRGEIAVRVIKTLRAMGIRSVAVYSDTDAGARHVRAADMAVRIGPAPARESYLAIPQVLNAVRESGAQAVHPGYGFLSENADFAQTLADEGVRFIGPPARAIEVMGDKITAKATVARAGVPVVPGVAAPGMSDAELIAAVANIGYPVLVKPSAGGGGKGMRRVDKSADLPAALASARREAAAAFGDDTLFLERFVLRPRHIEVQVLADGHGNVIHLGERECSLQRRHQKVIEEAPSPLLDAATRARIGAAACDTARSVGYTGAGTVEFIVSADQPDNFYFMEMNTRLQVEHPVTELVTGIDLVEWQVRVAAGERLTLAQDDIQLRGHAIEARVYAEDPARDFLPAAGQVLAYREPTGVRVDSGIEAGSVVGTDYDPMLAKVIAHGEDRATALRKLDMALAENVIHGVVTNTDFVRFLLTDADVIAGQLDTGLLDRRAGDFTPGGDEPALLAAAVFRWLRRWADSGKRLWARPSGWRIGAPAPVLARLGVGPRTVIVNITGTLAEATISVDDNGTQPFTASLRDGELRLLAGGGERLFWVTAAGPEVWVTGPAGTTVVRQLPEAAVRARDVHQGEAEILSPMPGAVIALPVADGAAVRRGDALVVVEAMKMEHALTAPTDGVVRLLVAAGDQVKVDQPLARVVPAESEEPVHGT